MLSNFSVYAQSECTAQTEQILCWVLNFYAISALMEDDRVGWPSVPVTGLQGNLAMQPVRLPNTFYSLNCKTASLSLS